MRIKYIWKMKFDGLVIFFFSSRRRHTRFDCDWSSDVCSSDLRPVRLDRLPYGAGLRRELKHGFVFSDCRVDDARLVVANAADAAARGARVLVGVECVRAHREQALWRAQLSNGESVRARAMVNAAGPWVKQVLNDKLGEATRDAVRLVKGSHIVLPRLYAG